MTAELHFLIGPRAGESVHIHQQIVIGRKEEAGLRFDPDRDLEVSGLHATILFDQGRWVIRDIGSRNGTFVNDRRVHEADLRHGDRITFGWQGPEVEFRTNAGNVSRIGHTIDAHRHDGEPVTQIIRTNRRLRWTAIALGVALVGVAGFAVWSATLRRSDWQRERAMLLDRIDSALAVGDSTAQALAGLAGEREGLSAALRESQADVRRVRAELQQQAGRNDTVNVPDLRRQLQSALAALERQQLAASLDYNAIEATTRRAVAVIWVEALDGTVSTGTAFAVRPDATLVTSRHVLTGSASSTSRPRRIGIQFSDSDQVWPARILQIAQGADVAIVKVDNIRGDVPVVASINLRPDTIPNGTPVAWIGFPLGGETWPQDERNGRIARPIGAVGVITGRRSGSIQLQGYGAAGASGSPILDQTGAVLAVLIGGSDRGREALLVGVSAAEIGKLLDRVATMPAGGRE